jgi:hypothetical protein
LYWLADIFFLSASWYRAASSGRRAPVGIGWSWLLIFLRNFHTKIGSDWLERGEKPAWMAGILQLA